MCGSEAMIGSPRRLGHRGLFTDLFDGLNHGDGFACARRTEQNVGRGARRAGHDVAHRRRLLLVVLQLLVEKPEKITPLALHSDNKSFNVPQYCKEHKVEV